MRLLTYDKTGTLVFRTFDNNDLPAYAILSHTWHIDNSQEVSLEDVQTGRGTAKLGFEKLQFCGKQSLSDGLRYFWVDTCCIDQRNSVELAESINRMFHWYQQASRCYVFLSDVPTKSSLHHGESAVDVWEDAVRRSRWFERGWTLQELIAPKLVVFYACNGEKLGDRSSLETLICEVTEIAKDVIRGGHLADFSFEEKMSWMENRNTKKEEDKVYSMLGIFGVSMSVIYGEGRDKALRRLRSEVDGLPTTVVPDEYVVSLNLFRIPTAAKFIARERELSRMQQLLYSQDGRSIAVLHGLGGIGKTQLAVTHLRRHKRRHSSIFWIDATSDDSILLAFNHIVQQILQQHPNTPVLAHVNLGGSPARVIEAVISWLSQQKNTRWLLIYDNYDNPKIPGNTGLDGIDLSKYLPWCDHGSIIITTRSSRVNLGPRIHIEKLTKIEEGLAILLNNSGRVGSGEDPEAIALVEELDGLPLALSTAGAYLEHVAMSFADYHRMYKASWLVVQKSSPQVTAYEDRSLYTTWQLSLDQIKQEDECAANLVKLWAYFDRQDVWYELLSGNQECEWLKRMTQNRPIFDRAVRLLCSYGLVDPMTSEQTITGSIGYSVHSCVHAWMIYVLNQEWDEELARVAISCVASMVPNTDANGWWLTQKRLLQHAGRCNDVVVSLKLDTRGMEWALHCLGDLYNDQGKLVEAGAMYEQALRGKEEALGLKHTSTLNTVNNLGNLYNNQGKFKEAETIYLRALQGYEEALGSKHTSTLNTINNLGNLYKDQGKLKEAEMIYLQVLQGKEEALGPKHMSTLNTVNNLGNLYNDQGKFKEAKTMYLRALQGYEEALGSKHTSTLNTINNLGVLYYDQGKFKEVETMCLRALQGKEEALGPKHTSTLDTVNNLSNLYNNQGKLKKAETMYLRALQGKEEALGPKHTSTLDTVNNLGVLYNDQGKFKEAETMYLRALQGYEEAFGPKHMSTLDTINNLGIFYYNQGKLKEAETMYLQALQGKEEVLGPKHTSTLDTVNNLGVLYYDQGKLKEAETMYLRALQGKEEALGPKHTSTLNTVNNLGVLYGNQSKFKEAETMYSRALQGYEEALGADQIRTYLPALNVMWNMGNLLAKLDQKERATQMYSDALSGFTVLQGQDSRICRHISGRLRALNAND